MGAAIMRFLGTSKKLLCCVDRLRARLNILIIFSFVSLLFTYFCSLPPILTFRSPRDLKSPKSPNKFSYGSKAADGSQYFNLEEPPRSPKITYSTPSPTSNFDLANSTNANSDRDRDRGGGGNTSTASGYFEQRSPKYLPQTHQQQQQLSPSSSSAAAAAASSSVRKFVFDAVSPRRESIGKCM